MSQLPLQLAVALRKALLKLGGKKKTKGVNRRALGVLKAFTLAHPVAASLQSDAEVVQGVADSGDLGSDLAGLFGEVGGAARAHEAGIFLTIDEMHQLPSAGLDALLLGLHRTNETGLPFAVAGAGLPSLAAVSEEARGHAERMFRVRPIGALAPDECSTALLAPAASEGVSWKGAAVSTALRGDAGIPVFHSGVRPAGVGPGRGGLGRDPPG